MVLLVSMTDYYPAINLSPSSRWFAVRPHLTLFSSSDAGRTHLLRASGNRR